jgi:hypothetical protein
MTDMQIGRVIQTAAARTKAMKRYAEAARMEMAMCRHYGCAYGLDDFAILTTIEQDTIRVLLPFLGVSFDEALEALALYQHSWRPL